MQTTLFTTGLFTFSSYFGKFVSSGILGLCAFVEAFPYDVPPFLPPILMELSTHLNDPQVIHEINLWKLTFNVQPTPLTIKKSLQEFKRTHQDNWQVLQNNECWFKIKLFEILNKYFQEHKTKFTEDQLVVMTDLLVSQNYYA